MYFLGCPIFLNFYYIQNSCQITDNSYIVKLYILSHNTWLYKSTHNFDSIYDLTVTTQMNSKLPV